MNGSNELLKQKFQIITNLSKIRGNCITAKTSTTRIGFILEAMMEEGLFEEIT
jgi:hypothetical protein